MPDRDAASPALLPVLGMVTGAVLLALLVATVVHLVVARLARHRPLPAELSRHARRPATVTLIAVVVYSTLHSRRNLGSWQSPTEHVLFVVVIGAVAWLVAALSFVVEDAAIIRYRVDVADNRHARRVRTQVIVVRRLTVAVIAAVAVGAMLMTFPSARAAGTSVLASAGVLGVVAGLAAQSTLSNLFAGMQIAFSDWLRLDDVVVVEGEWGRVEDITLSYVVVHLWDDRRLIFPTSYFTQRPFQNWTRTESAILGTVELDMDWSVPVETMREELRRVVEQTDLWDGRVCVLQVTDAVNGFVRVRALVSAKDAPTDWDLRCYVRERLVAWLQNVSPYAMPRLRVDTQPPQVPSPRAAPAPREGSRDGQGDPGANVFSGSPEGEERGATFAPPPDQPGPPTSPAPGRTRAPGDP